MYELRKVLNEIVQFHSIDSNFFFSNMNSELFKNDECIVRNIDPASTYKINDLLFFHNKNGEYCYYDSKLEKKDYGLVSCNFNSNLFIAYSKPIRVSRGVYEYQYYLLNSQNLEFESRITDVTLVSYSSYNKEFLFGELNGSIIAHPIKNKNKEWQLYLPNLGSYYDSFNREERVYKVAKFLGVWKEQLIVALREHRIITLNTKTGKIINDWKEIKGMNFKGIDNHISRSDSFVLSEE